jgi:hypothetical protein
MQWVLGTGVPVIAEGASTNALPGQVLRGKATRGRVHLMSAEGTRRAPRMLRRKASLFERCVAAV